MGGEIRWYIRGYKLRSGDLLDGGETGGASHGAFLVGVVAESPGLADFVKRLSRNERRDGQGI